MFTDNNSFELTKQLQDEFMRNSEVLARCGGTQL